MTFKFSAEAIDYDKLAQSSEQEGSKDYYTFQDKRQVACHIVALQPDQIGVEFSQYTCKPLYEQVKRTILCLKSTDSVNSFIADNLIEKGYTHYTVENGKKLFRTCPIKELMDAVGWEDNGKSISAKEKMFYIIVPYASRSIINKKSEKFGAWEPVDPVRPYWITGSSGKKESPHLRTVIESANASSRGKICDLRGNTFLVIERIGMGQTDTSYTGEVMEIAELPDRPSHGDLIKTIESHFDSLTPDKALDFAILDRQELVAIANKQGVTLHSLELSSANVPVQTQQTQRVEQVVRQVEPVVPGFETPGDIL